MNSTLHYYRVNSLDREGRKPHVSYKFDLLTRTIDINKSNNNNTTGKYCENKT